MILIRAVRDDAFPPVPPNFLRSVGRFERAVLEPSIATISLS